MKKMEGKKRWEGRVKGDEEGDGKEWRRGEKRVMGGRKVNKGK